MVRGRCEGTTFLAGVEKFFIPEAHSHELDRLVRGFWSGGPSAKVVLAVDRSGQAVLKELLLDDLPWQAYLAKMHSTGQP